MQVHVHIHNHSGLEMDILQAIHKLIKMTKADFDALRAEFNASITNIGEDITRLTERLVAGGLSAEEEEAVLTEFREVAARIKLVADRTADPGNNGN